eukprot:6111870-Lingulodinium_polyedra.AAC.1
MARTSCTSTRCNSYRFSGRNGPWSISRASSRATSAFRPTSAASSARRRPASGPRRPLALEASPALAAGFA